MATQHNQHLSDPSTSSDFPSNEGANSPSSTPTKVFQFDASTKSSPTLTSDQLIETKHENEDKPITVLLFGKAGDGKSTVGNMLLGGQVTGYFGAIDCPSRQISENRQWEVIDTVGLFSPGNRISDAQLIDKLHAYLVTKCPKIDVICYVKKASKYTGADQMCLNHFKRLFQGTQVERNVVLVFTFCPDKTTFLKFNDQLISKHMGLEYNKRVGVEFPPANGNVEIEEMMKEKRSSSLQDLEKELKRAVTENVGPVTLRRADHFSCYNTLNLFERRERLTDYFRQSSTGIDSPLSPRVKLSSKLLQ